MDKPIMIETSARHAHLSNEHIEALFGKGHTLTVKKPLSQPDQYACEERITVEGPKSAIKNVIVLGPARPSTQVEVSLTDARTLGLTVPVRESGDIKGSAACKLIGPAGEVELTEGVIVAKRHVHMTPEDAAGYGLADKQTVKVRVDGTRSLIFDDVVIRVSDKFNTSMHIDTDEANAAGTIVGAYIID